MKNIRIALSSAILVALAGCETVYPETDESIIGVENSEEVQITPRDLVGIWDVSLFFSPTAPPSATTMEIFSANEDGTLTGTFYNTEFETARYTEREGEIAFTVLTRDGSGLYATSGRLLPNGRIEGQTLAAGREFIMMWSAQSRQD